MWIEPKETSGGQWTGWEEVKRKRYFVLQRHLSADKPIERLIFGFRSLLSSSPQQPYRIIVSVRPFYAIALGANLKEILEHWKWVNRHLVKTSRLEALEEKEALALLNYVFSLLAAGKEDKAKQLLLPDLHHSTGQTAAPTEPENLSTSTTSSTAVPEDSPDPPAASAESSSSTEPSYSSSSSSVSTSTSPSSSQAMPTRPSSTMTSYGSTDKAAEPDDMSDNDLCKLCFESPIDTVILDCGHAFLCSQCADELRLDKGCPICRSPIRCVQKMYKC